MRQIKKYMAVLLSFFIAVMAITMTPLSVFAAEENTLKEEVVYINLNADGTVEEMNAVNILTGNPEGAMTDYGKYLDVRNMTTTDGIDYSGDTVKIHSSAEKLYYEGKLESLIMPWDIQIRYFLDGKEYAADEIAGKSGEKK